MRRIDWRIDIIWLTKLMDRFMPQWRQHRLMLNKAPLGHEDWDY
jgi:hypothetical protein